jgi:hypothetical protein
VWLLVSGEELFLPFDDFPELWQARISEIHNVSMPSAEHLFWPDLDFDLELDSLRHPERFPLAAKP